jgi:hypothetical protein
MDIAGFDGEGYLLGLGAREVELELESSISSFT